MSERSSGKPTKTLLVVSQVYVPDPASVGQHMADVAAEMVKRGWRVVVLTSARGYEDQRTRYPSREVLDGVEVRRLPLSSFGKHSIATRLLGSFAFLLQALVYGLFVHRLRSILVSTSPPMATAVAILISAARKKPFHYWVMDINPDQAVVLGKVGARSTPARLLDFLNRQALRRARSVIPLDRFMAARLAGKALVADRQTILPPWPHAEEPEDVPHANNRFRSEHGLEDNLVFMYSGNHSPSHPLTTILEAASRLEDRKDIIFLFIGGGSAKKDVDQAIANGARNVRSLPYQPLEALRYSLAAADVHLVTFGNGMVGIVHPCKAYGAMAASRPVLLVGPSECHIADIITKHQVGWQLDHGDVDGLVRTVVEISDRNPPGSAQSELKHMGARGLAAVHAAYSKPVLCGQFCDKLEDL